MSVPTPESPLDGHCSAVDKDTLYVYSSTSFQSLPLKEKAQWSKLDQGTPVANPACVRVAPGGDDSKAVFYVIGGSADDKDFSGVQRYTFSANTWETLTPPTPDMVGRTNHSVAYLPGANSILVYAGSQPQARSDFSSQTFVISLSPPFTIRSFTSMAPPGNQPILLTFDQNSAILVGSNIRNKELWRFNADGGWTKYDTELAQGITPAVHGLIVDGADGSKVLTTYDATVSPNDVKSIVLQDPNGKPARTGETVGGAKKRKRDLRLDSWPAYNSSIAPTAIRSDYAVTQDSKGLAVLSGGSSDSPINLFNNADNAWVDNGLFFSGVSDQNKQVPLAASSTTTPPASSTSSSTTSASTSAPPVLPGESSRPKMLRVLGITLGTLCGLAALFIILLLILRYRRQKKRRMAQYVNEKGDRMSFQDRGASFMKEAGGSRVDISQIPPNHRFTQHNTSHNSFAVIAGKLGRSGSRQLQPPTRARGSSESTRPLTKPKKADISGPVELDRWGHDKEVCVSPHPVSSSGAPYIPASTIGARESQLVVPDKKRSSGWSRYFTSGADGTKLPSAYDRGPTTSGTTAASAYTEPSHPSMPSGFPSSALVHPLDIDFTKTQDGQRISRVVTGSPSFNHSSEDLARRGSSIEAARGQTAFVSRAPPAPRDRDAFTPTRAQLETDESDDEFDDDSRNTYSTFASSDYVQRHPATASNWTPVSGATANTYDNKPVNGLGLARDSPQSNTQHRTPHQASNTTSTDSTPDPNLGGWQGLNVPKKTDTPRDSSSTYTASYYGHDSRVISARGNTGFFPSTKENFRPSSRGGRLRSAEPSAEFPMPPLGNFPKPGQAIQQPSPQARPGAQAGLNQDLREENTKSLYDGTGWGETSPGYPPSMGELQPPPKRTWGNNDGPKESSSEERDSTVTVFPRGVPSAYYADRFGGGGQQQGQGRDGGGVKVRELPKQDMSWLNLGLK